MQKKANIIKLLRKIHFGEGITNNFKIANFSSYKFSRLGSFFEEKNNEIVMIQPSKTQGQKRI